MEQVKESLSVLWISPAKDDLSRLLWCVFLAVLFCGAYLIYRRVTVGEAIGALMKNDCFSPESAKTPKELGLKGTSGLLQDARLVKKTEDAETRYYIPEELRKKAEYMQKSGKAKWWQALLSILALYLVLVVIYYLLPAILDN